MKYLNYLFWAICFISLKQNTVAQVTNLSHAGTSGEWIGWTAGTALDLNIENRGAFDINFFTDNIFRVTILGDNGFTGIGDNAPDFRLDVLSDINITSGTFPNTGFRFADSVILSTNSVLTNIYVGYGAGVSTIGGTSNTYIGVEAGNAHNGNSGGNTFIGNSAGLNGLDLGECTFIGTESGRDNGGRNNVFVGVLTGRSSPDSANSNNTFVGNFSGIDNTGNDNTFVGMSTGESNTVDGNVFIGFNSGNANTNGDGNTFVGTNSGSNNVGGRRLSFLGFESGLNNTSADNTFIGFRSGRLNTTGASNTFLGTNSGLSVTTGSNNLVLGSNAFISSETTSSNTVVGDMALDALTSGDHNVVIGQNAADSLVTGQRNTIIGGNALRTNSIGDSLVIIGYQASASMNNIVNSGAIGAGATVTGSNELIIGNNNMNVGVGLSGNATGPLDRLEISSGVTDVSGLKFRDFNENSTTSTPSGVVLTVDPNGFVVLTDDIGGNGTVTPCGATANTDVNFITKWTTVNTGSNLFDMCRTGIYEDPAGQNTVGIGVGSSIDNTVKMHLAGDLLITPKIGGVTGDIYMRAGYYASNQRVFAMYGLSGTNALAIGPGAGSAGTGDIASVYIGLNAGSSTANDDANTFIGAYSGQTYNSGAGEGYNTFIGANCGDNIATGTENTFIGRRSGHVFTSGDRNTIIGADAANGGSVDGDENVFIGHETNFGGSSTITYGSRSVLIGNGAHTFANTGSTANNAVSIGFNNRVQCDDCVTIASQVAGSGYNVQQVGIGYTNPNATAIGSTGKQAKLYVNDYGTDTVSAFFNGHLYSSTGGYFSSSDPMFKNNITDVTDVNSILDQLTVKTFDYKINDFPSLNLASGTHFGFLAPEVEAVLPELVVTLANPALYDDNGSMIEDAFDFKAVNYMEFIPILFAAVKEQKRQLDSLSLVLSSCCAQPVIDPTQNNRASISLSNNESIVLNQNVPNPFADNTEITYNIPESVENAVIMFYDQNGKILHKYEIAHRGAGSLTVYSDDLTSGIYTYTLIVDGKNHQTKRMMKQ